MNKRHFIFITFITLILIAMTGVFALIEPVRNLLEDAHQQPATKTLTLLEGQAAVSELHEAAEAIAIQLEDAAKD